MPEIEHAIVPAYRDGLAAEGWPLDDHIVREGFIASLSCRSALSAIPSPCCRRAWHGRNPRARRHFRQMSHATDAELERRGLLWP